MDFVMFLEVERDCETRQSYANVNMEECSIIVYNRILPAIVIHGRLEISLRCYGSLDGSAEGLVFRFSRNSLKILNII